MIEAPQEQRRYPGERNMYTKLIAHRAELPDTASGKAILDIDIVEAEDGGILTEGLEIACDRDREAFIRWFGRNRARLDDAFREQMRRNGVVVRREAFWYDDSLRYVEVWSLSFKWYNLLENSLQNSDPRRSLRIATSVFLTDTHVVLEVDDNGSGISLNRLKQIFVTRISLFDKEKLNRQQRRGFAFGGNGGFLRWFFDDIAKSRGNGFGKSAFSVEIATNCEDERSRCTIGTAGVCIDSAGKGSPGTRVRIFYPVESFTLSLDLATVTNET